MFNHNTIKTLPLRWGPLVFSAFIFLIFLNAFINTMYVRPFSALHYILGLYVLILFGAVLRYCVHYAICDQYLVAQFLGIPFRFIRWESIGHAMYIHAWRDIVPKYSVLFGGIMPNLRNTYGQIIYVTLKGCPRYVPTYHIRFLHSMIHPFHTACIWLPDTTKHQYIDFFRFFYPNLEIQPIDDWKTM